MLRRILVFRIVLLAAASLFSAQGAFAAHYYVSPQGTAVGDGSQGRPWDIATAFAHPPEVLAGDTIWLLGGVYELPATLASSLAGAEASPIIVRQALNQRATLDCRLVIAGRVGPGLRAAWRPAHMVLGIRDHELRGGPLGGGLREPGQSARHRYS